MNIIKDNIILRAIEIEDGNMLKNMINDPEIERNVLGWSKPVSAARQNQWIEEQSDSFKLIIEVNNNAVGLASITNLDFKNSVATLNIKIHSNSNRGKGYGEKIIKMLADYCFNELNLNCLNAKVLESNNASNNMFVKIGFFHEGTLRERVFKNGKFNDVNVYSLLKKEFNK